MAPPLTLNRKKMWLLAVILAILVFLVFVAGCLIGAMVSQPPAEPQVDPPEKKETVVRQKVPIETPVKKTAPPKLPVKPLKVQPPIVKMPTLVLPSVNVLKKTKKTDSASKPDTGPGRPQPADGSDVDTDSSEAEPTSNHLPKPDDTEKKTDDAGAESKTDSQPMTDASEDPAGEKAAAPATASQPDPDEKKAAAPATASQPDPDEKKVSTVAETFQPEYPYSLRLGSYQELNAARKSAGSFNENGVSTYLVKVHLGKKGIWWRIYSGYYRNQTEAMAERDSLGLEVSEIIRTRWANLIGIFDDEAAMASVFDKLTATGYYPYTIKTEDGRFRLFSGVFITRIGAETHRQELKGSGFESQMVQR